MRKIGYIAFLFLLISFSATAQPWRENVDLDEFVQNLVQQDQDNNYEDLYESLFQYMRSPINLNTTNKEELANLYILSDLQINSILEYREKFGDFISIYELQAVPNLDLATIYMLVFFADIRERSMNVGSEPFLKRVMTEENNALIYRVESILEDEKGYFPIDTAGNEYPRNTLGKLANSNPYDSSKYLGGSLKHLIRYRISHKDDYSFGFNFEKDSGEKFVWDKETKRYGFDFYSMHFIKYNVGRIKAIALGDYQLQFGQGLVMAGGFAVGKGAETTQTLRRSNTGIRPYTSTIESNFLRGSAATVEITKTIDATLFASYNKIDGVRTDTANIDLSDLGEDVQVSTEDGDFLSASTNIASGLHRTEGELAKKRLVGQTVYGANLSYVSKDKKLRSGFTFVNTEFSSVFMRSQTTYNALEFVGNKNATYGANYSYTWQNFNFFGEVAQSSSGGMGVVNGFSSFLAKNVEYAMMFRHFDPNFHSFYSNAFNEATRNINETGLYWGIKIHLNKKLTFAGYYDQFKFPWMRLMADAPTRGNEYLTRLTYKPSRSITMYAQAKIEHKEENQADNTTLIDFVMPTTKRQYILNLDYNASKMVSFKSRVQFSDFRQSNGLTYGFAIIQDVNYTIGKFQVSNRYAIFDTDDFDNRQYTFEKDVQSAFSVPAYNGRGVRTYFLVRYKASKKLDFWLKVGRYLYAFEPNHTIGSGNAAIPNNHETLARFQVKLKL